MAGTNANQGLSLLDVLDGLIEAGIYFMVGFGPWAFGTTEPWSINVMNLTGYALGGPSSCCSAPSFPPSPGIDLKNRN